MDSHVKVLGVIHLVFGVLGLLAGIVVLMIVGGVAGLITISDASAEEAAKAIPLLGLAGTFIFLLLTALSLPGIITGIGLLQFRNWGRVLGIILSVLELFNFPLGTAIGVYGLWVLLNRETEPLFR